MKSLKFSEFLNSKGISLETTAFVSVIDGYMRQPDICALVDEFIATILCDRSEEKKRRVPGLVYVKNIDCDIEYLRDCIDKISPNFINDRETFIFKECHQDIKDKLERLRMDLFLELKKCIVIYVEY